MWAGSLLKLLGVALHLLELCNLGLQLYRVQHVEAAEPGSGLQRVHPRPVAQRFKYAKTGRAAALAKKGRADGPHPRANGPFPPLLHGRKQLGARHICMRSDMRAT